MSRHASKTTKRRIFRDRRKPGYERPTTSPGPCDICGATTSDGYVFKRLDENIAAGKLPMFAMARACADCRKRADGEPEWGEAIADAIGEAAMAG